VLGVYDEDYVKVGGVWVCTGYDDIKAVMHDRERFSSLMPKSTPIVRRRREG
jgi:cytochrome P450